MASAARWSLFALAIVMTIAVVAVIAAGILNFRAEQAIAAQLETAVEQSPLADALAWSSVETRVARGTVALEDITFEDGDTRMRADRVSVQVPAGEAADLARDPLATTLSSASVVMQGVTISDDATGSASAIESGSFSFEGFVPLALFGDDPTALPADAEATITAISMDFKGVSMALPEDTGELVLGEYRMDIDGNLDLMTLMAASAGGDPGAVLSQLRSVNTRIADVTMTMSDEARTQFGQMAAMFAGPMPFLEDPDMWQIAELSADMAFTASGVALDKLGLDTPFLELDGSVAVGLSPEMAPAPPLDVDLEIASFHEELRPMVGMMLASLPEPATIPAEGGFRFRMSIVDAVSPPEITVE